MNCSTCKTPLPAGRDDCPVCSAEAPPIEGALAPDLSHRPPRPPVEPIRELPGKRRRERTWKDEVRERVDRRRKEVRGEAPAASRDEAGLPLFPDTATPTPLPRSSAPERPNLPARRPERRPSRLAPVRPSEPPVAAAPERHAGDLALGGPAVLDAPEPVRGRSETLLDDLPLRGAPHAFESLGQPHPDPLSLLGDPLALDPPSPAASMPRGRRPASDPGDEADAELHLRPPAGPASVGRSARPQPPALALDEPPDEDWTLDAPAPRTPGEARPVERPALALERLQAAVIDTGLLVGLAVLVVYFAGRVAQVPFAGLRPAWPFVAAYLGFLGLAYASYFTGTTGQTVGKILLGLRVVDTGGQAPGYGRALLRAALGTLGTLAAGLGLVTVLFDPAHRALHDRICRTRVISLRRT